MLDKLFKRKESQVTEEWDYATMFGPGMNFAVAEAYKLLRTNIMFSFPEEGQCHILGVTSSVLGEGKSTTCCNIAYSLTQAGKRVLLLEADLRRPSIATKLGLERKPGLTNLLVTRGDYREAIQNCAEASRLDILVSGSIPPNPSELLGSKRMARLMETIAQDYDYIVVDLPPVTAVSDAIAMSKLLDGVVMVVRSGVVDRKTLAEAMRQMQMVNVRILGFVYRDSENVSGRYGGRYGGKYGGKYGKKYYKSGSEYLQSPAMTKESQ